MQMNFANALWIDLLNPITYRTYSAYPEQSIIIVDEIQKVPQLLTIVHDLIEKNKKLQFILTGSRARKLKRTGADLLGGRALRCTLYPFMAAELASLFDIKRALQYGMLPIVNSDEHPEETLQAYINLYLHEEIQAEGLVRSLNSFARFLEAISFSHANQLNVTNVARKCEVKRKTVESYIDILEELLLAFKLSIFDRRAQRALSNHPKFYLFDAGIFNTLRPRGPLDKTSEINGAALEGLVAQHLYAWVNYTKIKHSLSFWRTRSGLEVDFIIYGPSIFYALEVKNATQIHNQDLKALQSFLEEYPEAKAILLYQGKQRLQKDLHKEWHT